jgi:asparagine synthase (glutamine-hydrolysing)
MCGLSGILHFGATVDAAQRVKMMADSIVHRGPDDEGFWIGPDVALGFRRLAIVDIESGHQPMASADGVIQVIYNGEIYNHRELRAELEKRGHVFRSHHSDTEVLVHGWREWGVCLPEKLNGMFAFALWDASQRSLFFARDRYGVKPLYFARSREGALVFGSEVRTLFASGLIERREDAGAISDYFGLMNFWHGRTPFDGVELMQPASWKLISPSGERTQTYWAFSYNRTRKSDLRQAAEEFRELMLGTVRRQVQADVPVMTYLSGGIDSSSITAAAYALDPKMRAYSCIFNLDKVGVDAFVDERDFSRAVASHLNIDRVELELPQDVMIGRIDHTISALEYPRMGMAYVIDLISQRVSQDAKVVLSGMGGDEITGGYVSRYGLVPRNGKPGSDPFSVYRAMLNVTISEAERPHAFTPEFLRASGNVGVLDIIGNAIRNAPSTDPWDVLMHVDATNYLHGLLVLEDKLSMSHSLETRVPLLDNELVDYLLETPWNLLCDGETGKILFREAVRPFVPDAVYRKPKMGFGPPDASWYRGALRSYVESILSPQRIARRGVFRPSWVAQKLAAHMSGEGNWVALIWCLLSFEVWCDQNAVFGGKTTLAA